jgi:redox-sensing transcriptional repressor
MLYQRFVTDRWDPDDPGAVTSAEIAASLDIDPTQVRKDLGSIGVLGKGRVGYNAKEVVAAVRRVLGFDQTHLAILLGAGHLGGALTAYRNFARYGLRIVAAFDNDPAKVGQEIAGCPVRAVDDLEDFIGRHRIRLAILTVPAPVAQEVSDRVVAAGIEAIWNFAPVRLAVPTSVCLRHEHLSLGFAPVSYHLTHGDG